MAVYQRRFRVYQFSKQELDQIDYKNPLLLQRFLSETGKLLPRRLLNISAKDQHRLALAVKRARFLGLLPYCRYHQV